MYRAEAICKQGMDDRRMALTGSLPVLIQDSIKEHRVFPSVVPEVWVRCSAIIKCTLIPVDMLHYFFSPYFRCYTVHVVKSLNYFTNHCTYINL